MKLMGSHGGRRRMAPCQPMLPGHGFTMVELLIVVALVAIGVSFAAPMSRNLVMDNRLTSHANALASAIALARSEAIRQRVPVEVAPTTAGNWSSGWLVRVTATPATSLAVYDLLPAGMSLTPTATRNAIEFQATGRQTSVQETRFWLCDSREKGRLLIVQPGGAVRIPDKHSALQDHSGC